jgi:HPt (histidine-containing phosphotransfer) domain-containing protein
MSDDAPHPTEDSAHAMLHTLSNLDTVDGLSRCMGNLALYQRLLKGFARTQHDFAAQLAAAPDRETVIRITHTLKGLAGNIGATRLYERTTELEGLMFSATADDPHDLRRQVQTPLALTLDALQAVLADIERLQAPKPAISAQQQQSLDDPAWQQGLAALATLVADHDAQARDCWAQLVSRSPALQDHALVQQVQRALDRYDFHAAAELLRTLRQPAA